MKNRFLTLEQKRERLLKGLRVPVVVHVDPKEEQKRIKEKQKLFKNFGKYINGR